LHSRSLRHLIADGDVPEPDALKILAAWYRDYADHAGNPVVWHARLATAEALEREAARLRSGQTTTGAPPLQTERPPLETAPRQPSETSVSDEGT
jgi:hypothetical protein